MPAFRGLGDERVVSCHLRLRGAQILGQCGVFLGFDVAARCARAVDRVPELLREPICGLARAIEIEPQAAFVYGVSRGAPGPMSRCANP